MVVLLLLPQVEQRVVAEAATAEALVAETVAVVEVPVEALAAAVEALAAAAVAAAVEVEHDFTSIVQRILSGIL